MKLIEKDIIQIINGSALLASGGGGSVTDGLALLSTYKANHPGQPIEVELLSVDEMDSSTCSVVIAGIGAPTKGANKDFTVCATSSFDEICKIAEELGKNVGYVMPIEMGGFNTFAPMLLSLAEGYPTIDADGVGRAVPGLDTTLVHINGYDTSPLAMGGENNDRLQIRMDDPRNAVGAQAIAGPVANGYFDGNAGIAGWIMDKNQIIDAIPTGTVSLAKKIGEIIEEAVEHKESKGLEYIDDVFERISIIAGVEALRLTPPTIIDKYIPNADPNFDNGHYYLGKEVDGEQRYKVSYENESLVLYQVQEDIETPFLTAPDIITMYNAETGEPVTNEDVDQNSHAGTLDKLYVVLGIIKIDEKWWKDEKATFEAWKSYFAEVDYDGGIIRYPE